MRRSTRTAGASSTSTRGTERPSPWRMRGPCRPAWRRSTCSTRSTSGASAERPSGFSTRSSESLRSSCSSAEASCGGTDAGAEAAADGSGEASRASGSRHGRCSAWSDGPPLEGADAEERKVRIAPRTGYVLRDNLRDKKCSEHHPGECRRACRVVRASCRRGRRTLLRTSRTLAPASAVNPGGNGREAGGPPLLGVCYEFVGRRIRRWRWRASASGCRFRAGA